MFGISEAETILKNITMIKDIANMNRNNLFMFDEEIFINHDKCD
jgi:hypothetical protein